MPVFHTERIAHTVYFFWSSDELLTVLLPAYIIISSPRLVSMAYKFKLSCSNDKSTAVYAPTALEAVRVIAFPSHCSQVTSNGLSLFMFEATGTLEV